MAVVASPRPYDVVLADPPWPYYGATDKWGAAAKFYPLMTRDELLSFPMREWMAERSVLFLWTTCPKLDLALECVKAWNLRYRGVGFVWVKTTRDGAPIGAQGVRPSIVKPLVELVLTCSTVEKGRPLPLASESVNQVVLAPKRKHSEKPVEVHERIEQLYPEASKVELFARRIREGWDCWGNEVG